jgi:hypothetical protein
MRCSSHGAHFSRLPKQTVSILPWRPESPSAIKQQVEAKAELVRLAASGGHDLKGFLPIGILGRGREMGFI